MFFLPDSGKNSPPNRFINQTYLAHLQQAGSRLSGNVTSQYIHSLHAHGYHGICYDFFFVAGQIYTDSKAGEHYRTAAQGMITLATYGVGMLAGFSVAGYISDMYAGESIERWQSIWLFPALFAVVVTVIFVLGFKDDLADSSQVKVGEV